MLQYLRFTTCSTTSFTSTGTSGFILYIGYDLWSNKQEVWYVTSRRISLKKNPGQRATCWQIAQSWHRLKMKQVKSSDKYYSEQNWFHFLQHHTNGVNYQFEKLRGACSFSTNQPSYIALQSSTDWILLRVKVDLIKTIIADSLQAAIGNTRSD